VSRISTKKKDSPTSRKDANPAATPVKTAAAHNARCSMPHALHAEIRAEFPSSPNTIARFIAAIALPGKDNII